MNLDREVAKGSLRIKRRTRIPLSPLGAVQDISYVLELGGGCLPTYEGALPCAFLCLVEKSFGEAFGEVKSHSCSSEDRIGEHCHRLCQSPWSDEFDVSV